MQDVVLVVFGVTTLLGLVSLLLPLANRLDVPYTVLLAVVGIGLGLITSSDMPLTGIGGDFLRALGDLNLPSDAFFYVFLPALLFNAGLRVDVRRLMDDVWPVFLLAVVAVIVCTGIVGFSLTYFTQIGLLACLLLGAIVSTTDAAAVVAIFRDIGAPQRLTIIVEGESLLNDAAAIVIFALLLAMITGEQQPSIASGALAFLQGLLGGFIFGYIAARVFTFLIGALKDVVLAEITLTLTLAYLTFIVSEAYLGVSGVIAVVTAAMVVSSEGRTRVSPGAWGNLLQTWKQLDFWGTSLIFIFAAMLSPTAIMGLHGSDFLILGVLFVATIVARFLVLYGIMPLFSFFGVAQPIPNNYNAVLIWGGLRGAMTIALAFAISENPLVSTDKGDFIFAMAVGYVFLTLFVQAPTLRPLMKLLGLDQLSDRERLVRDRVLSFSRRRIRDRVAHIAQEMGLASAFAATYASKAEEERDEKEIKRLDFKEGTQAGLLTLANREGELYFEYFQRGLLDRRIADLLRAESGRMLDRTKTRGAAGYISASLRPYGVSRRFRQALWLHRRFHIAAPLQQTIADRFETLLVVSFALKDLRAFNRESVSPLLGKEISDPLDRILEDRELATKSALEAMELQYPAYADSLRARYLERMAIGFENVEYRAQLEQSMISAEVYDALEVDRRRRGRALDKRPQLDLGLRLQRMIRKVELFRELSDDGTRALVRQLYPELAVPDERIIAIGDKGDCMYFIASGEVEVQLPGTTINLRAGDVFGEIALITSEPRTADVTAKGYVTLLVLRRGDFQRLTRALPELRSHIEKIAKERLSENATPGM
ncbi:MAG: cyclic nucleotide-binding domain-containing protein [Sphingomonadales bacterium]|nr:MAG: cyclic nucleotide-binding domain-containing protein [Sphingomonadales bacterium]